MSATERLRELLDERGIEYEVDDAKTVRVTRWRAYGDWVSFIEYDNGDTKFCIDARRLTPEQAIAATLWLGTCKADETDVIKCWVKCKDEPSTEHMELIHVMECSACGGTYEYINGGYEFCPRCRAKVVDE